MSLVNVSFILYIFSLISLLIPLLIALRYKEDLDILSPISLFSIFVLACYLFPASLVYFELDYFSIFWPIYLTDEGSSMVKTMAAVIAIIYSFYFGWYAAGVSRRRVYSRRKPNTYGLRVVRYPGFFWVALVLTCVSIVALVAGVYLLGGLSVLLAGMGDRIRLFSGLNYFFMLSNMLISCTVFWYFLIVTGHKKTSYSFYIYLFLMLLVISLQGAKSTIYVAIVILMCLRHYFVRPIPLSKLVASAVAMFIVLIIYQVVFRELLVIGEIVSLETEDGGVFFAFFRELSGNLMQYQTLRIIVDKIPSEHDFLYGKSLLALVTLPIPSSIYPDKLLTAPGYFTIFFWPDRWFNEGTSLPPGFFGEMYLNFGYVGIIVGGIVMGWFSARIYKLSFHPFLRPKKVLTLCVFNGLLLHYFRGEFVAPTLLALTILAPIFLIVDFSKKSEI